MTYINYDTVANLKKKYFLISAEEAIQEINYSQNNNELLENFKDIIEKMLQKKSENNDMSDKLEAFFKSYLKVVNEENLGSIKDRYQINFNFIEDKYKVSMLSLISYLTTGFMHSNLLAKDIVEKRIKEGEKFLDSARLDREAIDSNNSQGLKKTIFSASDLLANENKPTSQFKVNFEKLEKENKLYRSSSIGAFDTKVIFRNNKPVSETLNGLTGADYAEMGTQLLTDLIEVFSPKNLLKRFHEAYLSLGKDDIKEFSNAEIASKLMYYPDFMTNTYTAFLEWPEAAAESSVFSARNPHLAYQIGRRFNSVVKNELSFRLEGINIPIPKKTAFEVKFLNTSIKNVNNVTEIGRQLELSIREDSYLHFMRFFEEASGIRNTNKPTYAHRMENQLNKYDTISNILKNSKDRCLIVYEKLFEDPEKPLLIKKGTDKKAFKIFSTSAETLEMDKAKAAKKGVLMYRIWKFEGVRPLGRTSELEFSRGSTDPTTLTFKFIFRKVTSRIKGIDEDEAPSDEEKVKKIQKNIKETKNG